MDVVILAGGLGTRLRGLWNGPKCLVPVREIPVLDHLLYEVAQLRVRRVGLSLGYLAEEVLQHCRTYPVFADHELRWYAEPTPLGTAEALRQTMIRCELRAPLLVLNGDTLLGLPLQRFVELAQLERPWPAMAWYRDRYAGTALLPQRCLEQVLAAPTLLTSSVEGWLALVSAAHVPVPWFIDVGTPEEFHRVMGLCEQ